MPVRFAISACVRPRPLSPHYLGVWRWADARVATPRLRGFGRHAAPVSAATRRAGRRLDVRNSSRSLLRAVQGETMTNARCLLLGVLLLATLSGCARPYYAV